MLTQKFWKNTFERAVKTAAQVALAMIGGDMVGFFDVDWGEVGSVVLLSTIASVLSSIASTPYGAPDSPSLADD